MRAFGWLAALLACAESTWAMSDRLFVGDGGVGYCSNRSVLLVERGEFTYWRTNQSVTFDIAVAFAHNLVNASLAITLQVRSHRQAHLITSRRTVWST